MPSQEKKNEEKYWNNSEHCYTMQVSYTGIVDFRYAAKVATPSRINAL
jgi:hypothetical protein